MEGGGGRGGYEYAESRPRFGDGGLVGQRAKAAREKEEERGKKKNKNSDSVKKRCANTKLHMQTACGITQVASKKQSSSV